MQILLIDESGTPPKLGMQQPQYFVVAGVSIPANVWHRIRDALMGLKVRLSVRGELKWRYFAPGNKDEANPMRDMSQESRDEVRFQLYKIMKAESSIRIIACVCCAEATYALRSVRTQQTSITLHTKPVTERFHYYLQDLSKLLGRPEYGIVVADHRGRQEDQGLRSHHQRLLTSQGSYTSKYANLIESLLLQPSHLSVGIQFADLAAGAIWRKFERRDERWYAVIESSLRCDRQGKIDGYGLVKMPKSGWT